MSAISGLSQVTLFHYLSLSFLLFFIGLLAALVRKNLLIVMMAIELMLNAVNLAFVTMAKYMNAAEGQVYVFFIMTVAAAEAAVGLAIVVAIFKRLKEVHIRLFEKLRH